MPETIAYKGYKIVIHPDEDTSDPRKDFDNLGTMICFHRRYSLGDKDVPYRADYFNGWDELENALWDEQKAVVVLPLYLYDHSGITISTGPFSCPWDSGQVGFVYVTREQVLKEYKCKRITKKLREQVEKILRSEVEEYNQYLTGDVWGYEIFAPPEGYEWDEDLNMWVADDDEFGATDEDGEDVNSCWGFYGYSYCLEEAKSLVDWHIADTAKKEAERVSKLNTNHQKLFVEMEAVGL